MSKELTLTETTFYILLALRHPNHGYGIILEVEELTGNRVVLSAGTLYGAINTLIKKRWIKLFSEDLESRKKKEYILTQQGKEAFEAEVIRLKELVDISKIMGDINGKI